ncbi:MAG TPA: hypothetical protein DCP08_00915 [Chloroflexi bacterium]|nr:hypothetical protein [Chloroflexota bacterium]
MARCSLDLSVVYLHSGQFSGTSGFTLADLETAVPDLAPPLAPGDVWIREAKASPIELCER